MSESHEITQAVGARLDCQVGRLEPERAKFKRGDLVRKRSGSQWQGRVVGEYATALTPEGYAVESGAHAGSVQIYPASALELVDKGTKG
jgi:dihydrofolate reductase (trimethoprim resistance protein)